MPVTRSSTPKTRQSALLSSPRRNPGPSTRNATQADHDIIVLSDNDGSPAQKPKRRSTVNAKKNDKQRGKARVQPLISIREVVEISSEDEGPVQPYGTISQLQAKVLSLQKENASLKARNLDKKKVTLDISQIEDHISCEICTCKLWRPFILPECGHTFCQSCLEDWFNSTLAQYKVTHPQYNTNANANNHALSIPGHIRELLDRLSFPVQYQLQIQQPAPQYTCPICREQVKNKPIEDFALKSLVTTIAAAVGESTPTKLGGKAKLGAGRRDGTWDAFFRQAV